MFRKFLFILLTAPLLLAAINTRISIPVLLLMLGLMLVALAAPTAGGGQQD